MNKFTPMKKLVLKRAYEITFLLFLALSGYGQNKYTGFVKSANDGKAILGANIKEKSGLGTTFTNVDGEYSLSEVNDSIFTVSADGYYSKEIVSSQLGEDIFLSSIEYNEIGYGRQDTREISSAISSLSSDHFNKGNISDPMQLLQGRLAGVQIYNRGGNPNDESVVRIRGLSSFENKSPLIIIDGMIGASLSSVDPNDIEKFDVLKDGSAAAIYGIRANEGAIIITTKKGESQSGFSINYIGQLGKSSLSKRIPSPNAAEFKAAGGFDFGSNTDFTAAILQSGISNNHNISMQGGNEKTKIRVSANLRNVNSILKNAGFDQFNTRVNFSTKALNDKLEITYNGSYTNKNQDLGFSNAFRYAAIQSPTAPIYGEQSKYIYNPKIYGGYYELIGLFDSQNPLSIIEQNYRRSQNQISNNALVVKYNLPKNFTLNFNYSNQVITTDNKDYYSPTSYYSISSTFLRKGYAGFFTEESKTNLYEGFLNHKSTFGKVKLNLLGGYAYQQFNSNNKLFSLGDFPDNSIEFINKIEVSQDLLNKGFILADSKLSPDEKFIAFFGRSNIVFNNNIVINASIRKEGSTRLGENKNKGLFYAFSGGIDLNKYLKLKAIDLLKLRAGYGITGGVPNGYGYSKNLYRTRFVTGGDTPSGFFSFKYQSENPNLKWEEKKETNIGLEINTNRFSASVDICNRNTQDIIKTVYDQFISNNYYENISSINTKGIEFAINYELIKPSSNKIKYTTGIVISSYKSILQKNNLEYENKGFPTILGFSSSAFVPLRKGSEIGTIWGPVFDGIDENGFTKYKDINGDGIIQATPLYAAEAVTDFTSLGTGLPKLELGFNNQLSIGKWDISGFFRGAFGHSLVNLFRMGYEVPTYDKYTNSIATDKQVIGLKEKSYSSLYVEKADFLKLDNLVISRNIEFKNMKGVQRFNASLIGQNLFTLTNYSGANTEPALLELSRINQVGANYNETKYIDPLGSGVDGLETFLPNRTITLALNIGF